MDAAFDASPLFELLARRGLDFRSLGAAYLLLLVNLVAAAGAFALARAQLVITPNRAARGYGAYAAAVLIALLAATVLENELAPGASRGTLGYAAVPHLLLLLAAQLSVCRSTEPQTIAVAASAVVGALVALAVRHVVGAAEPAYLVAGLALAILLGVLWRQSISTKRAFLNAKSIYVKSKERPDEGPGEQRPWLGLPQWLALGAASVLLAAVNSLLRGYEPAEIPALDVLLESALLLAITAGISAVPAGIYWLTRRAWMPELTRFAWLAWIVVSFTFTYGNYLTSLDRA